MEKREKEGKKGNRVIRKKNTKRGKRENISKKREMG